MLAWDLQSDVDKLETSALGCEANRPNDSIAFQRLDAAGNDTKSLERQESIVIGPQPDHTLDAFSKLDIAIGTSAVQQSGRSVDHQSKAIFGSLEFIDVVPRSIPLHDPASLIPQRHAPNQKPAILAVHAPHVCLVLERLPRSLPRTPIGHDSSDIVRMKGYAPALVLDFFHLETGEFQPPLIDEIESAFRRNAQDQEGDRIDDQPETVFDRYRWRDNLHGPDFAKIAEGAGLLGLRAEIAKTGTALSELVDEALLSQRGNCTFLAQSGMAAKEIGVSWLKNATGQRRLSAGNQCRALFLQRS